MTTEYQPAREPTADEWKIREAFLANKRSLQKTAFELGIERAEVLRAVATCRWYLQDMGWERRYQEAIRNGFSLADARMHADMEASFNIRKLNGEAT